MRDKLIKTIREVPIADKTYPEYVEALADKLIDTGIITMPCIIHNKQADDYQVVTREKQIEEMAKDIEQARIKATDTTNSMNYGFGGWYAKELYAKGYRKASDVAMEIFEEIEKLMNEVYSSVQFGCYSYGTTKNLDSPSAIRQCGKLEGVKYLGDKIAQLKKKYTSEM